MKFCKLNTRGTTTGAQKQGSSGSPEALPSCNPFFSLKGGAAELSRKGVPASLCFSISPRKGAFLKLPFSFLGFWNFCHRLIERVFARLGFFIQCGGFKIQPPRGDTAVCSFSLPYGITSHRYVQMYFSISTVNKPVSRFPVFPITNNVTVDHLAHSPRTLYAPNFSRFYTLAQNFWVTEHACLQLD